MYNSDLSLNPLAIPSILFASLQDRYTGTVAPGNSAKQDRVQKCNLKAHFEVDHARKDNFPFRGTKHIRAIIPCPEKTTD